MENKSSRKSASKWEQSGERALIEIWGNNMNRLRGCRKNSHILIEMAWEMVENGYNYTPEELKTKMHNMTNRYRREKIKIRSTGGSPSEWDLYKEMENLLDPFESNRSDDLVDDSVKSFQEISLPPSPSVSAADPLSSSPSENSPQLRTSEKKNENIDRLIKSVEKTVENIKNTSEKLVAIEEEKKEIFKKFTEKEAEVQDALLEFLKRN